jgi:hypothetical protein
MMTLLLSLCACCLLDAACRAWGRMEAGRLPYGPTNPDEPPAAVNTDPDGF